MCVCVLAREMSMSIGGRFRPSLVEFGVCECSEGDKEEEREVEKRRSVLSVREGGGGRK